MPEPTQPQARDTFTSQPVGAVMGCTSVACALMGTFGAFHDPTTQLALARFGLIAVMWSMFGFLGFYLLWHGLVSIVLEANGMTITRFGLFRRRVEWPSVTSIRFAGTSGRQVRLCIAGQKDLVIEGSSIKNGTRFAQELAAALEGRLTEVAPSATPLTLPILLNQRFKREFRVAFALFLILGPGIIYLMTSPGPFHPKDPKVLPFFSALILFNLLIQACVLLLTQKVFADRFEAALLWSKKTILFSAVDRVEVLPGRVVPGQASIRSRLRLIGPFGTSMLIPDQENFQTVLDLLEEAIPPERFTTLTDHLQSVDPNLRKALVANLLTTEATFRPANRGSITFVIGVVVLPLLLLNGWLGVFTLRDAFSPHWWGNSLIAATAGGLILSVFTITALHACKLLVTPTGITIKAPLFGRELTWSNIKEVLLKAENDKIKRIIIYNSKQPMSLYGYERAQVLGELIATHAFANAIPVRTKQS